MAGSSDQELYQKLADALGISVGQAHEAIGKETSGAGALGFSREDVLNEAIKNAGATPSQTQLREGAQKFGGYSSKDWAALGAADKAQAIQDYINDPNTPYFSQSTFKNVKGEVKDPSGSATGGSPSAALQAISDYLTSMSGAGEAAMGAEGQQLAQQNQAVTSTVDQFLGGTSSGNAAVDAAQAAYAKAYSAGEGLNSAAYANMGAANAQYLAAAPEQPIVNLLTQGLGSGQFKELPQSLIQNLPESVQYALAQAGVGESQGTSAAPSYGQPIPAPKGGWPKSLTGGGSNASGSSASQLAQIIQGLAGGTNPNINPNLNQTLGPGNPNTPGS